MEPTYKVGDVVIVKVTGLSDVSVGDVVTFYPSKDREVYLTHRITEIFEDYEGTGVACFTTKGDANETDDGFVIDEDRLVGKVTFGIPKFGYVIRFIQLRWYFVIPLVVLIFVFFEVLDKYFEGAEDEEAEETSV